jgi:hypothetical protein
VGSASVYTINLLSPSFLAFSPIPIDYPRPSSNLSYKTMYQHLHKLLTVCTLASFSYAIYTRVMFIKKETCVFRNVAFTSLTNVLLSLLFITTFPLFCPLLFTLSLFSAMSVPPAKAKANKEKFAELAKKQGDEQLEFFLKRYYS